jgi:hypothetical protein
MRPNAKFLILSACFVSPFSSPLPYFRFSCTSWCCKLLYHRILFFVTFNGFREFRLGHFLISKRVAKTRKWRSGCWQSKGTIQGELKEAPKDEPEKACSIAFGIVSAEPKRKPEYFLCSELSHKVLVRHLPGIPSHRMVHLWKMTRWSDRVDCSFVAGVSTLNDPVSPQYTLKLTT